MWTKKSSMNDDNISMLIFLFIIFFFSINLTNGINNTNNNITNNQSLPIEKLLNQQYDNRQIIFNRSSTFRPWKKSNSIELIKKLIANRPRSTSNNRTFASTTITSMSYFSHISITPLK